MSCIPIDKTTACGELANNAFIDQNALAQVYFDRNASIDAITWNDIITNSTSNLSQKTEIWSDYLGCSGLKQAVVKIF